MLELAKAMQEMTCIHPEAEQMIWDLSRQLGQVSGKKTYGYLPKPMKKLVDEIVDQMVRLPIVDACYQAWWELQCQVEDYYSEEEKRIRPPLSQQKEFRQIKNAVIREAEHIRMNRFSFEDEEIQDDGEQISAYAMSHECQDLQSVANDNRFSLEERDEAAEQLEQLAEAGDAHAQHIIGTAYRDGRLLIPDVVKAQNLLEHAAEQEIDAAQYALGKLYLSDDADIHDSAKGVYWLKRSADNGNDYAAYRLGKEYLSGENVSKDAAAAEYLWQAANHGNSYAQYLLGKLYLMGEGVQQDTDTAYQWFTKAYYGGHTYAGMFMDRIDRGPRSCWRLHGCSTTWAISSGTTLPLCQRSAASTLTASGCRSFSISASPSDISRTIMSWNSNRGIRCRCIDSLRHKVRIFCAAEVNKTFPKTHRCNQRRCPKK